MKKMNVAIIGQGRSGRDIHGSHFKSERNENFNVCAVVEVDPERRQRALEEYPGCEVFENYKDLKGKAGIDLVVNSTFSCDHYKITKDLLEMGFNVLVEKPFARNRYECDELIKIAKDKGVLLFVFHQSLFAPIYTFTKDFIASGKLGDIKQIDIRYNGFSRRWDWQTSQVKMGGNIYNTGPHPIGYALGFMDFADDVKVAYSKLDHVLASGDYDDYAKIILEAKGKPIVDIEVTSIDAYPAPTLKIMGSRGTYKATGNSYEATYIVDGENPERPLILEPLKDENGLPAWCGEKLIKHEEKGDYSGDAFDVGAKLFYDMVYKCLTEGTEPEIPPLYAAKVISIIEQVHAANPLELKYL